MFGWLFRKTPVLPRQFTVVESNWHLDGGSIEILGRDEHGQLRGIWLNQRMWPEQRGAGRLRLGRYQIPYRSELEREVLALLRSLLDETRRELQGKEPVDRTLIPAWADPERRVGLLSELLAYVESDEYGKLGK